MGGGPLDGRHPARDRLAHDRVAEAQRQAVLEHVGRGQPADGVDRGHVADPGELGREVQRRRLAEHRDRPR